MELWYTIFEMVSKHSLLFLSYIPVVFVYVASLVKNKPAIFVLPIPISKFENI